MQLPPPGATPRTPPLGLVGDAAPPSLLVDRGGDPAPFMPAGLSGTLGDTAAPASADSSRGTSSGHAVPPRALRRGHLVGGGVILAAAILVVSIVALRQRSAPADTTPPPARPVTASPTPTPAPSPPPVAPGPPVPSAAVRLVVHTVPPTAQLTLDGAELANPFTGTFPRGDTRHLLVAQSRQHRNQSRWVVFDRDQELTLVLQPLPAGNRAPGRPASPSSVPSQPPPAASEPPGGIERGKRNKPKIITDFPG